MCAATLNASTLSTAIAIAVEEIATHNDHLPYPRRTKITKGWFDELLRRWHVGRTIKRGCKEQVRRNFDARYVAQILDARLPEAVTAIAADLQTGGLSALVGEARTQSYPISLASKVAFFYAPDSLPPIDSYARDGANNLLRRCGASQRVVYADYPSYCAAFETLFTQYGEVVIEACLSSIGMAAAQQQGVSVAHLSNPLLHRRIFDLVLMIEGGRHFQRDGGKNEYR